MASIGRVGFEQVLAVGRIKAAQRCVDRDRQLTGAEASEFPQEGDRQKLFFWHGEAVFGAGWLVSSSVRLGADRSLNLSRLISINLDFAIGHSNHLIRILVVM